MTGFVRNYGPGVAALIAVLALLLVGCSSKNTLDEESSTTVTVTASPPSVNVGEQSVVEATVTVGGTVQEGQIVNFSVTPSSAGTFNPTTDATDANGIAATIFTATGTGSAQISATTASGGTVGMTNVTVTGVQSGSGSVSIVVSPSLILANGTDTSVVTITVLDGQGQPAPDNTLIKLAAGEKFVDNDTNGYWTSGIDSLVFDVNANGTWDAMGIIPATTQTSGGTGQSVVSYIAGSNAADVHIKATVSDNGIQASGEKTLLLTPDATIHSLYLSSDSVNLVVRQTGGIETATLHAIGYDVNGNPVPEGQPVSFVILDPPGGLFGGPDTVITLDTVGYGPYSTVTNSQGVASVPIRSGTKSGTARIRAYTNTAMSNATQILVSAGPPAYIVVGASSPEECNVPYWDIVGAKVPVLAVVSDIYMNPVNDSTVVYFTTDEGTMKSHEERTQDLEGIATTVWISGNNVPTADGDVLVIAETAGGTVVDTGMFFNTHLTDTLVVSHIENTTILPGLPSSIVADGLTRVTVIVEGFDLNNNWVENATQFTADAGILGVQGGSLEDGCYSAIAYVKITSATLLEDKSLTGLDDDGIGAYDVVVYRSDLASSGFTIALSTGIAYRDNCSFDGPTSVGGGEAVLYDATIQDRWGNPLGDHTLTLTATGGIVTGGTQETNGFGEANGFTWTAPAADTVEQSFTLTLSDSDPRGGVSFTTQVSVPASN